MLVHDVLYAMMSSDRDATLLLQAVSWQTAFQS